MADQMTTPSIEFDPVALNRRGLERYQRGDAAGSLADFEQAAAVDPTYAVAWNNAGLIRQTVGRPADAIAAFDRAIAARPDYAEALLNRGRAHQILGDTAGARADFDWALECASGSFATWVLYHRAALRQEKGDLNGALADFDRALDLDAAQPTILLARGLARKEAGDVDGALADFDRALSLADAPSLAAIYHARGGVHVLKNAFADAVADDDRALEYEPDNYVFYISRGNARYHQRDLRGIADYRIALRLNPDGAAKEMVRLVAADVRRDAAFVLDNCAKHLRISDRDILAHARRAVTLVLVGRDDEAAPHVERVRGAVPDLRPSLERVIALAREQRNLGSPMNEAAAWTNAVHAAFADYVDS
jgi:tetratricopeptide (TPR) repeat protein